MQKNKIYLIGIGGIGISALARYYLSQSYTVFGSDKNYSDITMQLQEEGVNIIHGENPDILDEDFDMVIYSEAVPEKQKELIRAKELGLEILNYPQALGKVANSKELITIAGTHGKSTTTSITSLILKNSNLDFTSVVGTLLKEFGNKNFFYRNNTQDKKYFLIEACEYKRSFHNYKPYIGVITNIELDHLDYYKDLNDYMESFKTYINNIRQGGFLIINGEDKNCQQLIGQRKDINYIEVHNDYYRHNGEVISFPLIKMKVPGNHILFDAKIGFVIGQLLGIDKNIIIDSINGYGGAWRRMELIGKTVHNNSLYSDYGHHPTEIKLTLEGCRQNNLDTKILTIFQPHQYSRTYELLEGFKDCFVGTDELIISNIYQSRDTQEDIKKISTQKLVDSINHKKITNGKDLNNTLDLIKEFDKNNSECIIILMGAGNIDDLRNEIEIIY